MSMSKVSIGVKRNDALTETISTSSTIEPSQGQPKAKATISLDSNLEGTVKDTKINDRQVTRGIYLLGEDHDNQRDQLLLHEIGHLAASRQLVLLREGLDRDNLAEQYYKDQIQETGFKGMASGIQGMSSGYLYGVENPVSSLFTTALILNYDLKAIYSKSEVAIKSYPFHGRMQTSKRRLLSLIVTESNQEYVKQFWNSKDLDANPIFEFLKKNKCKFKLVPKPVDQIVLFDYASKVEKWNDEDWFNFTTVVMLILAEKLSNILSKEKVPTLNILLDELKACDILLKLLKAFNLKCGPYILSESEWEVFSTRVSLDLRDNFIAENLEAVYAMTQEKAELLPFVSILGENHYRNSK